MLGEADPRLAPTALERLLHAPPAERTSERAAREALRVQIAKLERDLSAALAELRPGDEVPAALPRLRGPRLLGLGELEALRDAQADRLAAMRAEVAERADAEAEKRILLERMLLEPGAYRWTRISHAELGEPGCAVYQSRPRLGIIGMLAGWWHVKVSSGCPLAEPRSPRGSPIHRPGLSPAAAEPSPRRARRR